MGTEPGSKLRANGCTLESLMERFNGIPKGTQELLVTASEYAEITEWMRDNRIGRYGIGMSGDVPILFGLPLVCAADRLAI